MLMMVVFTLPRFMPKVCVLMPLGLRKSCTNPTICTVAGGAGGWGYGGGGRWPTSNTGTVTRESLTITSFPARPVIGLSLPARNWKGGLAYAGSTWSPWLVFVWVRQLTASAVSVF